MAHGWGWLASEFVPPDGVATGYAQRFLRLASRATGVTTLGFRFWLGRLWRHAQEFRGGSSGSALVGPGRFQRLSDLLSGSPGPGWSFDGDSDLLRQTWFSRRPTIVVAFVTGSTVVIILVVIVSAALPLKAFLFGSIRDFRRPGWRAWPGLRRRSVDSARLGPSPLLGWRAALRQPLLDPGSRRVTRVRAANRADSAGRPAPASCPAVGRQIAGLERGCDGPRSSGRIPQDRPSAP